MSISEETDEEFIANRRQAGAIGSIENEALDRLERANRHAFDCVSNVVTAMGLTIASKDECIVELEKTIKGYRLELFEDNE